MSIKTIIVSFLACLSFQLQAQNIFPMKLNNCKTDAFCLDCGDIKAGYQPDSFAAFQTKLNKEMYLEGASGLIRFQILIDSMGAGCVLSHSDQSSSSITLKIVDDLNHFRSWTPAITNGKKEVKSSIVVVFTLGDNKISGKIERVDIGAFMSGFDRPQPPEIFNTKYTYINENLENYKITVWNKDNSGLPDNMNDAITIDKNGLIWLTTHGSLVTFNGKRFRNAEQNITEKGKFFGYYSLATDNNNVKWVYAKTNIYSFDNTKWTKYDSTEIGIFRAYEIINNPRTGEVFFCSDKGLTIYHHGKWTTIDQSKFKDLPSNNVTFAKRDSKNRIWIGTYSGTAMIDENNEITNFETTTSVLKGKCITSMDEDENGNLYFSLYEFDREDKKKVNNDEGIAIRYADGTFKQFTTENSGMPYNHANCVLYDRVEKILWISTDRAGLVRYDLQDGWENYHNENSDIPTSYVSTMTFDGEGNLYLATRQGLVKVQRK